MGVITMKYLFLFLVSTFAFAGLPPTTSKDSSDTSNVTTFFYQFPNFTGTHTGVTFSLGVNSVAGGGTGSTSFTSGSIPFSNGTILTQDNAKLFWNDSNFRLGIGTTAPAANLEIQLTATNLPGELIQGIGSQSSPYLDIRNSANAVLLDFNSSGELGLNASASSTMLQINSIGTGVKGAVIQEIASQTADILDLDNSSGVALDSVSSSGDVGIMTTPTTSSGLTVSFPTALPVSASFISTPNTSFVLPSSAQGVTINLGSDSTSYAASGLAYGINVNLSDAKPITVSNSVMNVVGDNITAGANPTVTGAGTGRVYNLSGISMNSVNPAFSLSGAATSSTFNTYGSNILINNSFTNASSGTNTANLYGENVQISGQFATSTAGMINQTSYAGKFTNFGVTGANWTTTGYGVWASASGDATDYDFYAASGNPSLFTGPVSVRHLIGNGGAPSIAAGAGAGTGPTVFVSGTDTAGAVIIVTGTLPTVSSVAATVTFLKAFATNPFMSLTAANAATALLSGVTGVFVSPGATNFTITTGPSGLVAATTYAWFYTVIQ